MNAIAVLVSLLARLREPSTWAGLAVLLQLIKSIRPEWAVVIDAVTLLFGGGAVVIPESQAAPGVAAVPMSKRVRPGAEGGGGA